MTKIIGIGLQRTGTTSLYRSLIELGIKAAPDSIPLFNKLDRIFLSEYDAFMDNPIPLIYRELNEVLTDPKFILTIRDKNSWLESVQWLFEYELNKLNRRLRKVADEIHFAFYGITTFDRKIFSIKWDAYHEDTFNYFENRSDDLLVIDIDKEYDWEQLCTFLNVPIPKKQFPFLNKSMK